MAARRTYASDRRQSGGYSSMQFEADRLICMAM